MIGRIWNFARNAAAGVLAVLILTSMLGPMIGSGIAGVLFASALLMEKKI